MHARIHSTETKSPLVDTQSKRRRARRRLATFEDDGRIWNMGVFHRPREVVLGGGISRLDRVWVWGDVSCHDLLFIDQI